MSGLAFVEIDCPLCGSDRHRHLLRGRDRLHGIGGEYDYVRCERCGLVFMNPRVVDGDLQGLYPAETYEPYQEHKAHPRRGGIAGWMRDLPAVGRFVRETLSVVTAGDVAGERLPHGARWLDLGCGNGAYLLRVRERFGCVPYGVDMSSAAVEAARSLCLDVFHGTIHEAPLDSRSFDVVSGWWYLEHVPDPQEVTARIATLLTRGGVVLLGVPNYASVNARVFRSRWYHLDCPRHLTIWTPSTLRRLLEGHGFNVERIAYDRATWGLLGSLRYALFGDNLKSRHSNLARGSHVLSKALLPWTIAIGLARLSDTVVVQARRG